MIYIYMYIIYICMYMHVYIYICTHRAVGAVGKVMNFL